MCVTLHTEQYLDDVTTALKLGKCLANNQIKLMKLIVLHVLLLLLLLLLLLNRTDEVKGAVSATPLFCLHLETRLTKLLEISTKKI